jgi:drug/metabolite transporter (DMT)-like permease
MTSAPSPAHTSPNTTPRTRLDASTLGLYALITWCWGTSWYALHHQLGVVAPEVALFWRFGLSTLVMFGWCLLSKEPLRFGFADHLRFAALGALLFSLNFLLFYHGGARVASGLLAVVFSTASIFNLLLGAAVLRQRIEKKVALGALIGIAGIGLIYWPEIAQQAQGNEAEFDRAALMGLALCIGGTVSFCFGNMVSAKNQQRGLPIKSASAFGMLYGSLFLAALSLILGKPFIIAWSLPFISSLIYLVLVSSVIAFAAYLTLLGRVGAARAGYVTVLFPVLALLISSLLENYHWTLPAMGGLGLVAIGNVLVLRR